MNAMKVATRTFTYTHTDGSRGEVVAGERIVADHALVRDFPAEFRDFGLGDELAVRSARVEELREHAARPAGREPVSRAGRAERDELRFWSQVDQQLHREEYTRAERAEQQIFDDGLRQIERRDEARLAEQTDEYRTLWAGRLPAER